MNIGPISPGSPTTSPAGVADVSMAGQAPKQVAPIVRHRVLLVDDQVVFPESLAALIDEQSDMRVVGQARDGGEALAALRAGRPDLVLLEVELDSGTGYELVTELLEVSARLLVVALPRAEDVESVAEALRRGGSAWVPKSEPAEHVLAVIRTLRPGECYVPPRLLAAAVRVLAAAPAPERADDELAGLTRRER